MNKDEVVHQLDVHQNEKNIQVSSEYHLTLIYEHFDDFRQTQMIRMTEVTENAQRHFQRLLAWLL